MSSFFALIKDISSLAGIPTASIEQFFKKRLNDLREAILCEVREGNFSKINEDDQISIAYKLYHSAIEGVAKNNLRLMCQVMQGMYDKDKLTPPLFLRYASMLATLSEEEIVLLGIMAKHYSAPSLAKEEVNKVFGEKADAIQSALLRTGLVSMSVKSRILSDPMASFPPGTFDISYDDRDPFESPVWNKTPYRTRNRKIYESTPLMHEFLEYTHFILKDLD